MTAVKEKSDNSFETNFKRLERLAEELQGSQVSIDELVPRMKEALQSIKLCKEVLRETKSQLKEISAEFNELVEPPSKA